MPTPAPSSAQASILTTAPPPFLPPNKCKPPDKPILRHLQFRMQPHAPLPLHLPRRHDIPQIFRNHIRRHKFKLASLVRPAAVLQATRIPLALPRNRRFDLHPHNPPALLLHRKVIPRRLSPARTRDKKTTINTRRLT